MKLLSIALTTAALSTVTPLDATACSVPEFPEAHPVNSESSGGTHPWIVMYLVKDSDDVAISIVDAKCKRDFSTPEKSGIPCAVVKPIEFDRNGRYLRPKAALPVGAHVQITMGKTLIGDFEIKQQHKDAVLFDGIKVKGRTTQPLQGCQLKGPEVTLTVKKTATDTSKYPFYNTMLLVYSKQPDPTNLLTNLVHINPIGPGDAEGSDGHTTLRDTSYEPKYAPAKFPAKVWVVFADEDGHTSPPTELTIK